MRNTNYVVINAVSSAGSITGTAQDSGQWYRCSVIGSFTDAASTGTLKLQGSNDVVPANNLFQDFTPTNWADIAGATIAVTAGGNVAIPVTELSHRAIRVVFTRTAGAGTLTARINAQGF